MKQYSFLVGFMLTLVVGVSFYGYSNYRYKEVSKNGITASCQVIKYRFWYEIRNCSKGELNSTQVGLNQIKEYRIQ